jgi:quercetin dioxygenase-like cupin family protein
MNLEERKPITDRVWRLQREMSKLPQVELETNHYFADGMYAREVIRPEGCLIVGKVHKKEHFYIVTKGRIRVTTDDGIKEISAPAVLVSKPGTKRAVLALEDSVCMTVHRTDLKDLDEIEAELVEPDASSLFDASNKVKALT